MSSTTDDTVKSEVSTDASVPTSSDASSTPTLEGEELENAILRQIEYYFSRDNLTHDHYLISQMDSDMYVSIETVAHFHKVQLLSSDLPLITSILHRSTVVQLDDTKTKIRPAHKPQRNTVILRDMPTTTTVEKLQALFEKSSFKTITSIKPDILNCWFVLFESEDEARNAVLWVREQTIDDQPIHARLKTENLLRSFYFQPPTEPLAAGGLIAQGGGGGLYSIPYGPGQRNWNPNARGSYYQPSWDGQSVDQSQYSGGSGARSGEMRRGGGGGGGGGGGANNNNNSGAAGRFRNQGRKDYKGKGGQLGQGNAPGVLPGGVPLAALSHPGAMGGPGVLGQGGIVGAGGIAGQGVGGGGSGAAGRDSDPSGRRQKRNSGRKRTNSAKKSGNNVLQLGPSHFPPLPKRSNKSGYPSEFKKYSKSDIVKVIRTAASSSAATTPSVDAAPIIAEPSVVAATPHVTLESFDLNAVEPTTSATASTSTDISNASPSTSESATTAAAAATASKPAESRPLTAAAIVAGAGSSSPKSTDTASSKSESATSESEAPTTATPAAATATATTATAATATATATEATTSHGDVAPASGGRKSSGNGSRTWAQIAQTKGAAATASKSASPPPAAASAPAADKPQQQQQQPAATE